jgi:L-fuculose-phosphate aldolase
MLLHELRWEVVRYCRLMASTGLVRLTSGNISARDQETGLIAVSPTSLAYDEMSPADVVVADLSGRVIDGARRPTSELPLHLAVYADHPEAGAVVHSHSVHATALGLIDEELPLVIINLAGAGGAIPVAPYQTPGTPELAEAAVKAMGNRKAVMLQNHGVVTWGGSLGEAFSLATYVEEGAHIYLAARMAGGSVHKLDEPEARHILDVYHATLAGRGSR